MLDPYGDDLWGMAALYVDAACISEYNVKASQKPSAEDNYRRKYAKYANEIEEQLEGYG